MSEQSKAAFRKQVLATLGATPSERLPLPFALQDPAFERCVSEAISSPELIENFDRLYGTKVGRIAEGHPLERAIDKATGFQDDQMREFVKFIHESIYSTLPSEAIHALRGPADDDHQ